MIKYMIKLLKITPRGKDVMKKPCLHCPYRKDRPNWLDMARTFYNVTLIHRGQLQNCHMVRRKEKPFVCFGAKKCLAGGNEQFVSPHELRTRPFSEDMTKDYNFNSRNLRKDEKYDDNTIQERPIDTGRAADSEEILPGD